MFVSTRRHKEEIARLTADLKDRDEQIAALKRRVVEAERTRHELIEEVRYVLTDAGYYVSNRGSAPPLISDDDIPRGKRLHTIGHMLPYLLSGRRHWDDPRKDSEAILSAKEFAAECGFTLSDNPVHAVKAMLEFASMQFNPLKEDVESLQRYVGLAA